MPHELSEEHAAAIYQVLIDHGVEFVIIGGMAARLHGHATVDVDICPAADDTNLDRPADALRLLDRARGLNGCARIALPPRPRTGTAWYDTDHRFRSWSGGARCRSDLECPGSDLAENTTLSVIHTMQGRTFMLR